MSDSLAHIGQLLGIAINPNQKRDCDPELNNSENDFLHLPTFERSESDFRSGAPKCFCQISTERLISSAVLRGLISQIQAQSFGNSGTSFRRSTSPANGGLGSCAGPMQS